MDLDRRTRGIGRDPGRGRCLRRALPAPFVALALLLAAGGGPRKGSSLRAQERPTTDTATPDTATVYTLESIVVTADRAEGVLASSTASVSVLGAERLSRLPVRGLADALGVLPGFAFLRFDGLGYQPAPTVRGFYGGGETEYVLLLVDGRPVNSLEGGTIDWNLVPLAGARSIEVIRGGASSLFGDAAVGGVVNVVTRRGAGGPGDVSLAGGSYGSLAARGETGGRWGGRSFSLVGDLETTDGFREHAGRTFGSVQGSLVLAENPRHRLALSVLGHGRAWDDPGPLRSAELAMSRTAASPFFRFDHGDEARVRVGLDGTTRTGDRGNLHASLHAQYRHLDRIRTLPLSAEVADTKNRVLGATRVDASVQANLDRVLLDGDRLTVGFDGEVGLLDTRYYRVVTGDESVYRDASGDRGELDSRGDGWRLAGALFAQYDWRPAPALRLTAGARVDAIRDTFDPEAPEDAGPTTSDHTAFSPKAGLNLRYARSARHEGHVYLNVARSFKAPTLDQLYDQRTTPVPFPPYSVTISNAELSPQHGTSVEAGLYHRVEVVPGALSAELTLSAYRMDMEDELDFDLQTFRYVNLGASRHQGLETGLTLGFGGGWSAFLTYTRQDVTARRGPNEGKRLKAVPRDFGSLGVTGRLWQGLEAGLTVQKRGGVFLDDANTVRLPGYSTVDGRLTWDGFGDLSLFAEGFNLLDDTYLGTGFPDPAGSGVLFLHPAAGRTLRLGVRMPIRTSS